MAYRHLIDIEQLSISEWDELSKLCKSIIEKPSKYKDALKGRVMASLFYEPSTRTNFSFQAAMQRLGGSVIGFSDPMSSSVAKGETLKDTIKMMSAYADVIVMRSPKEGSALAASLYADCPVINAGDGGHMHPTQTLADLTTIDILHGEIKNLNIGICGDLKNGRTVHSLIKALSMFPGIRFYLISPRDLSIPLYIRDFLNSHKQWFIEVSGLEPTMPHLDVLYMTRIQRERFRDPLEYDRLKGIYVLTRGKLDRAKKDMIVMHPLPRVDEIDQDVDEDPRAAYFQQATFGMYARMALLITLINTGDSYKETGRESSELRCENPNCITATEPYLPRLCKGANGNTFCIYCDREILE